MARIMDNEEYLKFSRKAMSTRLQPFCLEYFLKFAQENETLNISDTFNRIIERLSELESLQGVTFESTKFDELSARVQREFLHENPKKKKETISLAKKKLPPIRLADDVEDDETESDVLEI